MIRKCLFPAAGYRTSFLPATKAMPKEMLPILTKPLTQYGVEEALGASITTMAIVTGRGKRFDCGSVEGFVEAKNYFAKARKNS